MPLHLHIEATCHGNPGPSALGYVVRDEADARLAQAGRYLGERTDLEVVLQSLLDGLEEAATHASDHAPAEIDIHTSSQWLRRQLTGQGQRPGSHLEMLVTQAQMLLLQFQAWQILPADEEGNALALSLASHSVSTKRDVAEPTEVGGAGQAVPRDRVVLVRVVHGAEMRTCPEPCGTGEVFEFGEIAPAYMCLHALASVLDVVMACKRGDDEALAELPLRRRCAKPGCGAEFEIRLASP